MSQESSKQLFWLDNINVDPTLAAVNSGTANFVTDFLLGDQMALEVCFKKTSDFDSGITLVGYCVSDGTQEFNDNLDYRTFFAGSKIYCDCGYGRYEMPFADKISWHIIKFPVKIGGVAKPILDESSAQFTGSGFDASGNFGLVPTPLRIFDDVRYPENANQPAAIRYINVWRYGQDKLLASFWPDKRGGFVDAVSGKVYYPVAGEVEVKKWEEV